MFSCEFSKLSKNTFFTEHLRATASAFSFSEAATRDVLWKDDLENFAKFTGKHLWFTKFSKTPLDDCFWLFCATLLKLGTANNVWKNSVEYSLPRNTNLRSTVQIYHFFLGSINFQCMFSLVYTVYCQKQPSE